MCGFLLWALCACLALAEVNITANIDVNTTWFADTAYNLNAQVTVLAGATLTIQPGTTIRGKRNGVDGRASALIISRGARIIARGTSSSPITFTAQEAVSAGNMRGLWGGLVIAGYAVVNGEERFVEGLTDVLYGGSNNEDDSGVLQYVRIWHGGADIGANPDPNEGSGDEINGLTLAGVGSRTIVEHVEVAYNLDDGFEMFGGTVNLKWCSSLFNQDDAFDADLGYQGKMQFLFALVDQDGHHAAEIDGNMNVQPRSFPTVYGATFMKATNTDATALVKIREGSGGEFHNMILEGYAGFGLRNEECGNETQSSVTRGTSPNYLFWSSNNIVSTQNVMGSIAQFNISAPCSWAAQSRSVDSQLTLHPNVWREPKSLRMIDPRPQPGGNAFSGSSTPPNDGFFLETNYVGAFSDTELWLDGWSWLSENGFLPAGDVQVTPDNRLCGNYTTSRTLSSGVTYYLTCQTFVKSPAVLTIEAGTTIKAYRQDEDGRAPTLVIEQGAKIIAQGSSAKPITFTSVLPSSVLPQRGTWGGLILLGKGIIAGGGTRFIEGIDGGAYGGTDNEDDSGVLSYVRVWYGGADVGDNSNGDSENSGIEINGITFGAVGSRTVVDHCEVAFNLDDGFEAFGGAVNLKHCSSIFNGDDAFDTDEGYRGKMQFLFAIVDGAGNHAAEMDGNEDVQPRSFPQVNGATFLKAAQPGFGDGLMRLREGTGGEYYNIVLLGRAGAGMENKMCFSETKSSSGNGSDPNYLFWDRRNVINTLTQGGQPVDFDIGSSCNWENGPESSLVPMNLQLLPEGWSTYEDLVQIDPRPTSNSPTDTAQIEDSFFSQAAYPGGFPDSSMWLDSWSWLSENGMVPAADVNPSPSTTLCGAIETSMTIHSSETYYLTCQAFVKAPNILTIERGATIRAYARDKDGAAPALTIERGAKIMAQGSPTQPITMTNVLHSATLPRRKTWGGLIVLGAAPISGGENSVEGLPSDLGLYGGTDPTDSSGVLQYVRVWYGGADIELNVDSRENSGNEINGITLAGVGNGTIVEHCEVAWNHDDGFEMFGGTVNLKWCSSVYNKDDAFDTDEGYQGKMQFLFALVDKDGHHAAEMDSKTNGNIDSQPRSYPRLYGATFIKASHTSGDGLMKLREGTAGEFGNIILAGEAEWGVQHEDCGGERHSSIAPSFPDTLFFSNNNIINTVSSDGDTDTFTQTDGCAWDAFPNPRIVDSHLLLLPASWESTIAQIDPRPRQNSHAFLRSRVDSVPSNDNFFSSAPFVGGFGSDLWISEWTYLAETGRLPANEYPTTETTLCGRISESKRLVASRTYYMTCQVFVEPGQTLTIEAGTTIKSYMHDKNGEATALIIEKGAKIIAAGTASQPITFTSVLPQKELPKRGTWGGVIILGNATINTISGSNTIEGVRAPDGEYGGADDDDNSGTLRYVRIWYGGADISPDPSNPENSGNEINGLTLGGVGAGTTVEYCEVAYNLDDGFEAFGGTVSLRFCSSVFNGDDQFDFDEGYRGQLERLFAFAGANGDRAIECDSESDGGRDAIPRTRIEVVHSTFIGNPTSNNPTVKIREGASGVIALSIITDASENGVGVELTDCSPSQRNSATSIFPTVPRQEAFYFDPSNVINATLDFRIDETCANESLSVSKLGALRLRLLPDSPTEMSRMIDPRPMDSISGPYRTKDTWMTAAFATTGPFSLSTKTFNIDNYNGAFDSSLWLDSWSMLSASGMLPADEYTGDPERLLCGFIITSRTLSVGTYYMTCQVFVKRPAILTIPAGTTIKAYAQDAKGRAPALIIQQGAKIMAEGTINAPITFTSVKPPFLLPSRGNWGGVILLGLAKIAGTSPAMIEGIEGDGDGDEGRYGGNDDEDSSGIMKYVRVWYGGADIGVGDSNENSGNEINGITFGGVGNKTVVEHCEVAFNLDDGFEMFGGTVNLRYCSSIFNGDDAFDTDAGYRGHMQHLYCMVGEKGHHCVESDSNLQDLSLRTFPKMFGATFVGGAPDNLGGNDAIMKIREGSGGLFGNIIMMNSLETGIKLTGCDSQVQGPTQDPPAADNENVLYISPRNIIYDSHSADQEFSDFQISSPCRSDPKPTALNVNPNLLDIPYHADENSIVSGIQDQIDPRPDACGNAYKDFDTPIGEGEFFETTNYKGGFGSTLWLSGMSLLSDKGFLSTKGVSPVCVTEGAVVTGIFTFTTVDCALGKAVADDVRQRLQDQSGLGGDNVIATSRCGSTLVQFTLTYLGGASEVARANTFAQSLDSPSSVLGSDIVSTYGIPRVDSVRVDTAAAPNPTIAPTLSPTMPTPTPSPTDIVVVNAGGDDDGNDNASAAAFLGLFIVFLLATIALACTLGCMLMHRRREMKLKKGQDAVGDLKNDGASQLGSVVDESVADKQEPVAPESAAGPGFPQLRAENV